MGFDGDEARAWLRWMKATPVSLVKLHFLNVFFYYFLSGSHHYVTRSYKLGTNVCGTFK